MANETENNEVEVEVEPQDVMDTGEEAANAASNAFDNKIAELDGDEIEVADDAIEEPVEEEEKDTDDNSSEEITTDDNSGTEEEEIKTPEPVVEPEKEAEPEPEEKILTLEELVDKDSVDSDTWDLVEEVYNKIIAQKDSSKEKTATEIQRLQDELEQSRGVLAEISQKQYVSEFESSAEALDVDIFGAGGQKSITKEQLDSRIQLDKKMSILAKGYHASGENVPDVKHLAEEAYRSIYGAKKSPQRRALTRPSNTNKPPASKEDKAVQASLAFDKKLKF